MLNTLGGHDTPLGPLRDQVVQKEERQGRLGGKGRVQTVSVTENATAG